MFNNESLHEFHANTQYVVLLLLTHQEVVVSIVVIHFLNTSAICCLDWRYFGYVTLVEFDTITHMTDSSLA